MFLLIRCRCFINNCLYFSPKSIHIQITWQTNKEDKKPQTFDSFMFWSSLVCVYIITRRKDNSQNLRKAMGGVIWSSPNNMIFFLSHSTVRRIVYKRRAFKTAVNLPRNGCPSRRSPRSDRLMLRDIKKSPVASACDLQPL